MATSKETFAGSIPEIYDRLLVPLIFESYARDLARRLTKIGPRHVLETAAGTGVLTRAIASALPADARMTTTDFSQPMLDHARARQSADKRIQWQQADATALPFADRVSMRSSASSARCSFPIGSRDSVRRGAY